MLLFLLGIALLAVGYFSYGKFIEKILKPDDRQTPAEFHHDGVDFLVLPHWKNMLIQLLNIAGIGPVIGVIIGIKFGIVAFLIIPIGNIIAGATHDFIAGMMSIRSGGANLPRLIQNNLGKPFARFFSLFMTFLLFLVVAVFINIPANLTDSLIHDFSNARLQQSVFWIAVTVIFIYYICATLFPVDKIIGRLYPVFGAILVIGTLAILAMILYHGFKNPALLTEGDTFRKNMIGQPIVPVLFVTIACGIISGFHATQSPIIARTMRSEKHARQAFYGMMVVEGIIAMIWAGAALMFFNLFPGTMSMPEAKVLGLITTYFLGTGAGTVTVISVIILAVTSGDTAMRSLRLSLAEEFHIGQKPLNKRLMLCLPLIAVIGLLLWWSNSSAASFSQLWKYFAWANQVLAGCTLFAATVWLLGDGKPGWIAALPGTFMTFIVICYIVWVSKEKGGPVGLGLPLSWSYIVAGVLSLLALLLAYRRGMKKRKANWRN